MEILITMAAFLLLLSYHVHLIHRIRKAPMTTSMGVTNHLRREWVQMIMEEKRDILAVQTLRNLVMASNFLASTAILIGLGTINFALCTEKAVGISQALNLLGPTSERMWLIKLMVFTMNFFFSFFNFTLSIRYYNHASFVINHTITNQSFVTYDYVTKIINRGTDHYTLGMRSYYLAVPFTLWLFGSIWMLMGATILIIVLYTIDRTV